MDNLFRIFNYFSHHSFNIGEIISSIDQKIFSTLVAKFEM